MFLLVAQQKQNKVKISNLKQAKDMGLIFKMDFKKNLKAILGLCFKFLKSLKSHKSTKVSINLSTIKIKIINKNRSFQK
jgi:uncharacterized protein YbcV (DUF1398 family)